MAFSVICGGGCHLCMLGTVGTDEDKLLLEALNHEFINVDDCDEANDDGEPFEITGDKLLGLLRIFELYSL